MRVVTYGSHPGGSINLSIILRYEMCGNEYLYVLFQIPTEKPPIRFLKSRDELENPKLESEVTTQLVDINFNHQAQVTHNFQNNK